VSEVIDRLVDAHGEVLVRGRDALRERIVR
jgi:hypothetical protein